MWSSTSIGVFHALSGIEQRGSLYINLSKEAAWKRKHSYHLAAVFTKFE
jgi:hypothetical protein